MVRKLRVLSAALLLTSCGVAVAQDSGVPVVTVDSFQVRRNLSGEPEGPFGAPEAFDPTVDLAREYDLILLNLTIDDPDWPAETQDDLEQQAVDYLVEAQWLPYLPSPSPVGPPFDGVGEQTTRIVNAPATDVAIPGLVTLQVPKLNGPNVARLRGEIPYDVSYLIRLYFNNPGAGFNADDSPFFDFNLGVIENPAARPKNPPPFADAGGDSVVEAGSTVKLDASRSFDSSNLGFSPLDTNVYVSDVLTYQWEWIAGPERVEPVVRDPQRAPAVAEVTLNTTGEYVFRVAVSDSVSPQPSFDQVKITVVSIVPPNRVPNARIAGPTGNVLVGSAIALDGTGSSDPDGDALVYRWVQTDELGGKLPTDDIGRLFQPLSGVNEPIATWQAIAPGTYYFRLIVNDGKASATATTSVTVVETATAGATAEHGAADSVAPAGDLGSGLIAPGACGAGFSMAALAPLALLLVRSRGR